MLFVRAHLIFDLNQKCEAVATEMFSIDKLIKKRDISGVFLSFYFFSDQSQRPGHYRVDVILCKIDKMSKKDDWEGKKKEGATPRVRPKMDSLPSFSLSLSLSLSHTHALSLSHTHTRSRRETRSREKECEAFG